MRFPTTTIFAIMLGLSFLACGPSNTTTTTEPESAAVETAISPMGGLALYTLRDTMATNPKGVLQAVADMGYAYVEAAGYSEGNFYGMPPTEFKAYLEGIGLQPMSSHHGDVTQDNADEMIAAAKAAGFQYFVIPIPPMGHFTFDPETGVLGMSEEVEEVMSIINTIAEKCHAAGIQCLYHNHDFEFTPNAKGIVPMDYFIENSNPEHLSFQLDLYWAIKVGAEPIDYFHKAAGRIKSWHVKDMDEQGRFAPVGEGTLDFARLLPHKDHAGMEFFLVEQDMTFNHTPLEAVAISRAALPNIGFE